MKTKCAVSLAVLIAAMVFAAAPAFAGYEGSLVAYWQFAESGGSVAEDSAGTNDGTIYGATVNQPGVYGGAYRFDGANDYVDVTGLTSSTKYYTFSLMAKSLSDSNSYFIDIQSGRLVFAFADPDGLSELACYTNSWTRFGDPPSDNQWHHYSLVVSNTTATVYLDGSSLGSQAILARNIGGAVAIGMEYTGNPVSNTMFNGYMDDFAVWNRALDSNEVEAIYLIGVNKFENIMKSLDGLGISYDSADLLSLAELEAGINPTATVNGVTWYSGGALADWESFGWEFGDYFHETATGDYYIFDDTMTNNPDAVPSTLGDGTRGNTGITKEPAVGGEGEGEEGVPEPSAMAVGGIAIGLLGLLKRMRKNTES